MTYKKTTDVKSRINSSITLRMLVNTVKREHTVTVNNISDISCEFTVQVKDEGTRAAIDAILGRALPGGDYEVAIVEDKVEEGDEEKKEADKQRELLAKTIARLAEGGDKGKTSTPRGASAEVIPEPSTDKLSAVMDEIHALVGFEEFKRKAEELLHVAPKLKGIDGYMSHNTFLFSIDDGSGISTATRLLSELLNALGLIPRAGVAELPPVPYVDTPDAMEQTMGRYAKWLSEARGAGIAVFDLSKCYGSLAKSDYREFLTNICDNERAPLIVFRIPYLEEQVRRTVEENLGDRFFLHTVPFVPLSMEELYAYAERSASAQGYTFDENLRTVFTDRLAKEKSDGKFYGFRTVDKVLRALIYEKAKSDRGDEKVIAAEDLVVSDDFIADMQDLSGEEQLHMLYGLEDVVKQIEEVVSFIEYAKDDPKLNPSFHMKFVGNPGTGKTTVARILGKILKEKGILRTGVFFEYSGNDFIAQYVGHTAPKTAQMCRDAYGGVLFIDEAYALSPGRKDMGGANFKEEALNTLLTEMENHRRDMLVIMAGYEEEIDELMKHNPGLSQRVPYTIRFGNYSKEALANIFFSMASKKFLYEEEFMTAVKTHFDTLPNNVYYSPTFSNARYVRNLYERTVSKAVLRACMEKTEIATLIPADFEKAVEELKNTATASSLYGKDASGATMFNEESARIRFEDVCGQDEAKEMLAEIVDYLKDPEKYKRIGARVPRGALLYGPPGTGKTMLAKAVAGEAGVPVLTIAGSDFISSYVGQGAEKVKNLFEKANKLAPSIVFIDEIDAIAMSRNMGNSSSALMQLLTEMDGFDENKTVIVLAATNRPEELDPALRRPGRFDREIPVELPDLDGRVAILAHYLADTRHEENIDLRSIGNMTTGFSGADLRNIVNEAAHRALREGREMIAFEDLSESVEVVMVGYVKKNKILSEKEKWIVCYHEIGHALLSALQTHTAPVKKITVVPRTGGTLGYVMHTDSEQRSLSTKSEMEDRIAVCVAGRAAEEVHFGEITTGASNDIKQATALARAIVSTYGMTDEFDMVAFETSSHGYLGGSARQSCSDATAERIDRKVVEIVKAQHEKALCLLRENETLLDALAAHIHKRESITGDEFMEIFHKYIG